MIHSLSGRLPPALGLPLLGAAAGDNITAWIAEVAEPLKGTERLGPLSLCCPSEKQKVRWPTIATHDFARSCIELCSRSQTLRMVVNPTTVAQKKQGDCNLLSQLCVRNIREQELLSPSIANPP